MNLQLKKSALASALASVIFVTGCTTTGAPSSSASSSDSARMAELDRRSAELDAREASLRAQADSSAQNASSTSDFSAGGDLLPPNAAPGECYARVWVDAEYRNVEEQVIAREASQKINVIPAQYETVSETVLVSAASSRIETTPAEYGTESQEIEIREGQRQWRVGLKRSDAPASQALLAAAASHQVDLKSASVGMCFHEHYVPATYETVSEQVLVKAATEKVSIVPAEYQMVEKSVLVRQASSRLVQIPAEYETESEQVIDKPAHTIWKKGNGPIQKINEATGEIMCLVEVPATYKTVTRSVLRSPARTETVDIPAEYKTVQVRELVSSASEQRTPVPAVYGSVDKQVVNQKAGFVWHEVSNQDHPSATRTGNKICLTETQPEYKTVTRTVVTKPAESREIEIPAEYRSVEVTKLVSAAREDVTVIPAEYKTLTRRELTKDGYMAWRSILCDTNMTRQRITDIQRALQNKGYDIGSNGADGIIGSSTIAAVNAFQRDNELPVDKYLNIKTVKALGISTK